MWRAWNARLPKNSRLGRIVTQASFYACARALARRIPRPDIVVSYTDPPFFGFLALRLKRRYGIPFVYYCQDLYPDVLEAIDMAPPVLTQAFRWVQKRLLAGADRVIALGEDMAVRLRAKGVEDDRICIIHNWVDTQAIRPVKEKNAWRREHRLDGKFVVMYSGNFGHIWDLDTVLDAAASLRDRLDIQFCLIGSGSRRAHVEQRVKSENLSNVSLLPYQPKEELSHSLSAADVHVVPMRAGVYGSVVPSKVYGILAAATPMVVLGEAASEPGRIIASHGCGWRLQPRDHAGLAHLIRSLPSASNELAVRGQKARQAAERCYSREDAYCAAKALLMECFLSAQTRDAPSDLHEAGA